MSLQIIKPGFLSTIQDSGRWGFQSYGVPVSGAMDYEALANANILVGNAEGSCGIEFTMHGAEIEAETDMLIALGGGGSRVFITDLEVPFGKPVFVRKGSVLKFTPSSQGCRSYLAVAGGFKANTVMSSASTYLPSGFGGIDGRALGSGDRIKINDDRTPLSLKIASSLQRAQNFTVASWGVQPVKTGSEKIIRIFKGPEWNWFSEIAQEKIESIEFSILPSSNRMGYRLKGDELPRINSGELISTSVTAGTIQCTPDGNLIMLMADCQATGGYPRIAQVAAADLSLCAQLRTGDQIRFSIISFAEAEQLLLARQRSRNEMKRGIAMRFGL